MNEKSKKIKSQKLAAVLLMVVPSVMLISVILEEDFNRNSTSGYLIISALAVLIICGGAGLKNSLRRERNPRD